jgi:hypothetical protein
MARLCVKIMATTACLGVLCVSVLAQDAPGMSDGPMQQSAPIERQTPAAETAAQDATPGPAILLPPYDPEMFRKRTPPADLAFLKQYDGAPADDVLRDKRFKHVLHDATPGVMFHYGHDMSLPDAVDAVMQGSTIPVKIRDGRYVTIAGRQGRYLAGRGFIWVDLQEGIVLDGFFFHPTPSVTVFSRQVKEDQIESSQLPPEFETDLMQWQMTAGVPIVMTRYFIGDANEKLLLEHDEDYCSMSLGRPGDDCMQFAADAADDDEVAADYLAQVHYATNGTAWMINSPEQVAFVSIRDRTCGAALLCRVRLTRERVHVIERRSRR